MSSASSSSESEEIKCRLVNVSSQDDNLVGGLDAIKTAWKEGRGWTSSKYCHFPQELVFSLPQLANIQTIQILCHEALIPTKIDVFVGRPLLGATSTSWSKAQFDKLGSVEFLNNAQSNYKARELKIVRLDAVGSFVKLSIDDNYKNPHNEYNQVAILNVNVFGNPVPGTTMNPEENDSDDNGRLSVGVMPASPPIIDKPKQDSPKEDRSSPKRGNDDDLILASGMSYTQEIQSIIKLLERKKQAAIRDENFPFAKRLKEANEKLQQAGQQIDFLNDEKRAAVEDEDYDRATKIKTDMDTIRTKIYKEIGIMHLLTDTEKEALGLEEEQEPKKLSAERKRSASAPSKGNPYLERDNMVLPAIRNQQRQQVKLTPLQDLVEQEEKLPSIERTNSIANSPVEQQQEDKFPIPNGEVEEIKYETDDEILYKQLPAREAGQLSRAVNLFGAKLVLRCTSKQWQHRQQALQEVQVVLDQRKFRDPYGALEAALQILKRVLRDKIFNVYKTATNVLRYVLVKYLSKHRLVKAAAQMVADSTYYILIVRTGDTVSDSRFRTTSIEFAENSVQRTEDQIGCAYATCFLRPFQSSGQPKIDQGHAEIAERIIVDNQGPNPVLNITESSICQFAISCLQHTDPSVRQTGVRLLLHIFKYGNRAKVRSYLPRNDDYTKKKWPLYKTIFDEFDRVEGVNSQVQSNGHDSRNKRDEAGMVGSAPNNTVRSKTPQTLNGRSRQAAASTNSYDTYKMCVFCGEVNETFDEETLDVHYLKLCPMLTKCQHCKKVVEIATLKSHLYKECPVKDLLMTCPRCKEPLLEAEYKKHQIQQRCLVPKAGDPNARCLLCHKDISPSTETGWKNHLIGSTGCVGNPRKRNGIGSSKRDNRRRNSTGGIDVRKKFY